MIVETPFGYLSSISEEQEKLNIELYGECDIRFTDDEKVKEFNKIKNKETK